VTLVGVAAHLMHQPLGDGGGLELLAARYGHDLKALDQVRVMYESYLSHIMVCVTVIWCQASDMQHCFLRQVLIWKKCLLCFLQWIDSISPI
jgi:hypothetical protein